MKNSLYSVILTVEGGRGGDGLVSFRHAAFQPRGGPDGGDGGSGGNVLIKTDAQYHTLEHLHYEPIIQANKGAPGRGKKKHGKNAKDRIILVPPGTTVYTQGKKEIIADMGSEDMKIRLVRGGEGGQGNIHFATSTNQTPRIATKGHKGEKKRLILEFNPIIDVAVIGPPNSGKSSLIAILTGGSPDINSYPFTTKRPHLWTCSYDYKRFTFLDTPPLVPEYFKDIKTLIRRARILIVVLDYSTNDIPDQIQFIEDRITSHFAKNEEKSIVIVLNKIDEGKGVFNKFIKYPVFQLSTKHNRGVNKLKLFIFDKIG